MPRERSGYPHVVKTPLLAWRTLAVAAAVTALVMGLRTLDGLVEVDSTPASAAAEIDHGVLVDQPDAGDEDDTEDTAEGADTALAAGAAPATVQDLRLSGIATLAAHAEKQARLDLREERVTQRLLKTPFSLTYATFNILGSNHTAPGADADHFAPGRLRAEWAAQVASGWGMDIIGFSEIQSDQLDAFLSTTGGNYSVWPGSALGGGGVPTSIVWDNERFTLMDTDYVTIPFVGQQRPQPIVRLKEMATGREFFVFNAHNAPQDRQTERNIAMSLEIAKIKELRATGLPVIFGGDLNEKSTAVCKVTTQTDLAAASPMGNYEGCGGWSGMRIDWIFGSPQIDFSGYTQDRSALVSRITDHAVIVAKATIN